ncbi:helix-turn-helix transcriptional regulator [Actinomadura sp. WMMB 499]|uniref:helix-turn-helix domain-containing protein n=1 Tax=Actinomadura sp. WMMB 499 TaxID=1219491 RepID=UPI001248780E|nr:helix-turn-helix transcriptional regulator [Actinomadura sp. WMMB 499]
MRMKEPADPRGSLWGLIGYHLRHLRTSQGLTGPEAARVMGVAPSTISRIESGEQRLTEKHATEIDNGWRTGGLFGFLIYYARRASDPDWYKSLKEFEQIATELRIFGVLHIPGLVQTEAYARTLLLSGRNPDPERSLQGRLGRQQILQRADPPDLWVTISEALLNWPVGGAAVMEEQLQHLLALSEQPNIYLRVVPRSAGAYEGLDGPFQILKTPGGGGDVAFVEAAVEGRLVVDADDVHDFRNRWERIGAKALPEDLSRSLIQRVMEENYCEV